jgi:hypothetical protein
MIPRMKAEGRRMKYGSGERAGGNAAGLSVTSNE